MRSRERSEGFTLLELMIASTLVTGACLGVLMGFLNANRQVRVSADAVSISRLLDAKTERYIGAKKVGLCTPLGGTTTASLFANVPMGTPPWGTEANPLNSDLGQGSYWQVSPDGTLTQAPASLVTGNPPCADVPANLYCRETFVSCGLATEASTSPLAWSSSSAKNAQVYTVWTRIWKTGDPSFEPLMHVQVGVVPANLPATTP